MLTNDENLLSAAGFGNDAAARSKAGFVGLKATNDIDSASQRGAVNQAQLGLSGEQERFKVNSSFEDRGMGNSSQRMTALGWQAADQANRGTLLDIGVNDAVNGANVDVMQELARQSADATALAEQRRQFDQEFAVKQRANAINQAGIQQWLDQQGDNYGLPPGAEVAESDTNAYDKKRTR